MPSSPLPGSSIRFLLSRSHLHLVRAPGNVTGAGRRYRTGVLPLTWQTVRLFLHVLAATVWVGGQITLAALVPALRAFDREVTRVAARRFNQVAWVAFAVLVVTGVWNILALPPMTGAYRTTLIVKLAAVAAS